MTFKSLGLIDPILLAVEEKGYQTPSPIQAQTIPAILQGKDVMASAQTGTGKTAGFVLPILQKLSKLPPAKPRYIRTLILAPTRELAAQIEESTFAYGKNLKLKSAAVFGGVKSNPQIQTLQQGIDILIATPGRLMDLYEQNAVKFNELSVLVLDEADRMLDMGFIKDIRRVLALLPKNRQNLLFSATFSNDIFALAKGLLRNPVEINVAPRNATAKGISQVVYPVDKARKAELLSHLIQTKQWYQALIFCRTKHGANKLVKSLHIDGIEALAIHGNKSQAQRTKALAEFKQGKIQILVATDIAARGLDIDQLPFVVNFDLPNIPEDYVHRIGRTGRAGAEGQAISLVCADEIKELLDIERLIKAKIQRQEIESFEPRHTVPSPAEKSHHNARPGRRPGGDNRSYDRRSSSSSSERSGSNHRAKSSEQRSSAPFRPRQDDHTARPARGSERRSDSSFRPREENAGRGRNTEQRSAAPFRSRQDDHTARPARGSERRSDSSFRPREENAGRGRNTEQRSAAPFRSRQDDNTARPARGSERRSDSAFRPREENAGRSRSAENRSGTPFRSKQSGDVARSARSTEQRSGTGFRARQDDHSARPARDSDRRSDFAATSRNPEQRAISPFRARSAEANTSRPSSSRSAPFKKRSSSSSNEESSAPSRRSSPGTGQPSSDAVRGIVKPKTGFMIRKDSSPRSKFGATAKAGRSLKSSSATEKMSESSRQRKKLAREEYGHED